MRSNGKCQLASEDDANVQWKPLLNLKMIETLRREFLNLPIGYSGHEVGLVPSAIAVALGACMVERHLTLD